MKLLFSLVLLANVVFANSIDVISKDYQRQSPSQGDKIISYSNILKDVRKSVVSISTQKVSRQSVNPFFDDPFFRQFFDRHGQGLPQERVQNALGSGVIIKQDGYIVTNNHVIENAQKILVSLYDNKKQYQAKVIGVDPKSDLAVIKIDAKNLHPIKLYDSDKLEVGDMVFAIGNPFGVGETITSGIISAKNRNSVGINEYEDFIQTDAPINPGNSGGALVNSLGLLVGINSAILTRSGGSHGVGFSIPSNMVARVANALIDKGVFKRAWLGVTIERLNDDLSKYYKKDNGVIVTNVAKDSPAQKAGIKRGDLILEVDGVKIKDPNKLKNAIGNKAPNSTVTIKLQRSKKERTIKLKLANLNELNSSGAETEYKGLHLAQIDDVSRQKYKLDKDLEGLVVVGLDQDSLALKLGLRIGDVIVQIEQDEIKTIKDFKQATKSNAKKRFFVHRNSMVFVLIF